MAIRGFLALVATFACLVAVTAHAEPVPPERVTFLSRDGTTTLVGYLFNPAAAPAKAPAVVMMHGRGGIYAANARGKFTADTLSLRHTAWGRIWADAGYVALLVDSFGPRGYPKGFPRFSYADRPEAVSEVTVRPLDAYAALAWLRARPDVIPDRIGLHGWSNGGGAAIAADRRHCAQHHLADTLDRLSRRARLLRAMPPACRFDKDAAEALRSDTRFPRHRRRGDLAQRCDGLVRRGRAAGGEIEMVLYPGATHGFDAPDARRQAVAANVTPPRTQRTARWRFLGAIAALRQTLATRAGH